MANHTHTWWYNNVTFKPSAFIPYNEGSPDGTASCLTSLYWEYTTKGLEGARNLIRPSRTGEGWNRLAMISLVRGDDKTDD